MSHYVTHQAQDKPLRVLLVNKFHFANGGSEVNYFGLTDILREHGHYVGHFSMKHPENVPSEQERFFVENINYDNVGGLKGKLAIAAHTVYSFEARGKLARLLDEEPFDLVHLHNFHHQITPSILPVIKKRGIPVVFTLHDFKLVCPNYKLFTHDGVCERCKGGRYFNAMRHRCTKGSLAASAVNTVEMYFHRFRGYDDLYDFFITPARFTGRKIVEFGIPCKKVCYVPNFVWTEQFEPQFEPGEYFLYLGRLASEKGVPTLVDAMKAFPEVPLRITGRGPCEADIHRIVRESGMMNLKLTGHISGDELKQTIRGCKAIIMPAEWYENCPLSVIEAYAYGKPVIGAKVGGLGEMVIDGETGFQFESGSVEGLVTALRRALDSEQTLRGLGRRARRLAEQEYDASRVYDRIITLYRCALEGSGKPADPVYNC